MKTLTEKTYSTSSAAYRAIRHFDAKNAKSNLIVEKISVGSFKIVPPTVEVPKVETPSVEIPKVESTTNTITNENGVFRFFPNGIHGAGYYQLKKGDRRRPNSMYIPS